MVSDPRPAAGPQGRQELYFDPTTYACLGSTHRSGLPQLPEGKWRRGSTEPTLDVSPDGKVSTSARAAWEGGEQAGGAALTVSAARGRRPQGFQHP
ncbi:hypothetical protein [Streptomyces sp. NPDC053367]|uniref:hypothetical protein n=1 Tax=Streptomyces sp. NPDC053367 TaxID=3365700 RepID=UPI0037D232A5